jgi:hypothetical protein
MTTTKTVPVCDEPPPVLSGVLLSGVLFVLVPQPIVKPRGSTESKKKQNNLCRMRLAFPRHLDEGSLSENAAFTLGCGFAIYRSPNVMEIINLANEANGLHPSYGMKGASRL